MELALLICGTLILTVLIVTSYLKHINSQEYKCTHTLSTKLVREGKYTKEYLSTCSKCGYQSTHTFKGLNL